MVSKYRVMAPKLKSVAGSSQSFDASKFLSFETQKKIHRPTENPCNTRKRIGAETTTQGELDH